MAVFRGFGFLKMLYDKRLGATIVGRRQLRDSGNVGLKFVTTRIARKEVVEDEKDVEVMKCVEGPKLEAEPLSQLWQADHGVWLVV